MVKQDSTTPTTMHELRSCVADKVRRLRDQRGWSQRQLAERAGIDRTHLARFETQAINVSLDVLFRLAGALQVPPCRLLLDCHCQGPAPVPGDQSAETVTDASGT